MGQTQRCPAKAPHRAAHRAHTHGVDISKAMRDPFFVMAQQECDIPNDRGNEASWTCPTCGRRWQSQ